jgi:UDP-2,3-diacylglucosamine pyrophosphatase LpxH
MIHPGRISASTDRVLVVLSDIEVAAGGCHDDFLQSEFLVPLLASYTAGEYADKTVELVLNGDTFDFLKVAVDGAYPHHITAEVALAKWALIAKAHAPVLDAIRDFLQGDSRRKVHFIVGNHDLELAFPEVQEAIALRVGWHEQVTFPGMVLRLGDVHIEHGHQMDRMFQVDPDALFVPHGDTSILNLPWGSVALLEVAMPLQPLLYFLDRLKPRKQVFEVLPETKELLISLYWRYWTRDYLRGFRSGADPLKRFTWTMAKEILYRFRSADPDVDNTVAYHQMLRENEDIRLLLTGHDHTPGWWEIHHRKHLQTGSFRNEFLFSH